jgi:hypothetical protein
LPSARRRDGAANRRAWKSALLSVLIAVLVLGVWHLATLQTAHRPAPAVALTPEQIEYARLMGKDPATLAANAATGTSGKSGFPTLGADGRRGGAQPEQPVPTTTAPTTRAWVCSWATRWAAWRWATCWRRWWPFRWAS